MAETKPIQVKVETYQTLVKLRAKKELVSGKRESLDSIIVDLINAASKGAKNAK